MHVCSTATVSLEHTQEQHAMCWEYAMQHAVCWASGQTRTWWGQAISECLAACVLCGQVPRACDACPATWAVLALGAGGSRALGGAGCNWHEPRRGNVAGGQGDAPARAGGQALRAGCAGACAAGGRLVVTPTAGHCPKVLCTRRQQITSAHSVVRVVCWHGHGV